MISRNAVFNVHTLMRPHVDRCLKRNYTISSQCIRALDSLEWCIKINTILSRRFIMPGCYIRLLLEFYNEANKHEPTRRARLITAVTQQERVSVFQALKS